MDNLEEDVRLVESDDYDLVCMAVIGKDKNMMIPWYLMACYSYYVQNKPMVTDQMYDLLLKNLNAKWDGLEHQHKEYISLDSEGPLIFPPNIEDGIELIRSTHYDT